MELNAQQQEAKEKIQAWLSEPGQQIFRLFGYAGTGKTTILKDVLNDYYYYYYPCICAYSGKAAEVLRRKGLPAKTIHSALYMPRRKDELLEDIYYRLKGDLSITERHELEQKALDLQKPAFNPNPEGDMALSSFIVLDEVSMVNEELARDILSLGKKVLVVGDPGQLPPIEGGGYFIEAEPDAMLTQIERQQAGDPIIIAATQARQGMPLKFGGSFTRTERPSQAGLHEYDQVLAGTHKTRYFWTKYIRDRLGLFGVLPEGKPGEKIIMRKNYKDLKLFNGQPVTMEPTGKGTEKGFYADIITEDGRRVSNVLVYAGLFQNHHDGQEQQRKIYDGTTPGVRADWAHVLTVHSAQGSEWDRVFLLDDWRWNDREKWLYTAITRAAKEMSLAVGSWR